MSKETTSDKKYNATVTRMFDAPKFAAKALKGEEGAAFLSAKLDADSLAALKTVQLGGNLVLKKSPKLNTKGGFTYFLEVLPPYENTNSDI